ncbi:MAG TPA: LuxR C-terminal-related transcriptional regulator [Legionellaceae bacterium]|nr:LuxR C-terminal-related transcriptional regulator [Legionellaceae bacterium]
MQISIPNMFGIDEFEQYAVLDKIVVLLDINFNIIYLNPLGEKIFGWPRVCVHNKNFVVLCEEHDIIPPIPRNLLNILHTKTHYKINMSITNRFGENNQATWLAEFIHDSHGTQLIFLSGELTPQNALQPPLNKTKAEQPGVILTAHHTYEAIYEIIKFLPGCSYMKDINGKYLGGNDYLAKSISGVSKIDEIVGHDDKYLAEIIGSRWPEEFYLSIRKDDMQVMEKNKPLINKVEPAFLDANGHVVLQLSTKMPFYSEHKKIIGLFGISLDVSSQLAPLNLWTLYNKLYQDKCLMLEKLLSYIAMHNGSKKISLLSYKELECLIYMSNGKTSKEIAKMNGLSFRTVEKHIENMKEKSNCRSRSELIKLLQYGIDT